MNLSLTDTHGAEHVEPRLGSERPIVNAMTVDVEDWVQSVLDPELPLSNHFVANTHRIMAMLERHGVRATFFVLGLAAEKSPDLIRALHAAGHEIQSHGYAHRLLHTLSREEVIEDLTRSKRLLEDITGELITAYRAPAFSITRRNPWVLDALIQCGYTTDSSIVPAHTKRYGIAGAPWYPHRLRTPGGQEIVEVPVATASCLGRRIPMGGGGYFRLFPARWIARALRRINRAGRAATIYMHPYEFNPGELNALPNQIPWRLRLHQGLGRRGFARKLERLITSIPFGPLRDVLRAIDLPRYDPRWTVRTAPRVDVERIPPASVESVTQTAARD